MLLTILTLFVLIFYGSTKPALTSGPFRSNVKSIKRCDKTTYPFHPNPPIVINQQVYNTTAGACIRGTFEVLNYTTDVTIKTKSLIWENGKWKTNLVLLHNGCRGSLLSHFLTMINIKFDKKKCAYNKCRVTFDLGNTNKLHHFIVSTAEYGEVKFISEMIVMGKQYKTINCNEYKVVIEPA